MIALSCGELAGEVSCRGVSAAPGVQTLVAGSAEAFVRVELWCTDAPHEQPAEARHVGAAEAAMLSAAREAHEPIERCVAGLRLMLSSLAEDERQCYQVLDRSLRAHLLGAVVACTVASVLKPLALHSSRHPSTSMAPGCS